MNQNTTNERMVPLEDFVPQTLIQIVRGTLLAQKELGETATISPPKFRTIVMKRSISREEIWKLEEFLLHAIAVAGKNSSTTNAALQRFYKQAPKSCGPFNKIRYLDARKRLIDALRAARLGNYGKNERAFREAAESDIDLTSCTIGDLENIHGVGPKSSRYFLLHSRGGEFAALDTHVLKWLREQGYDAPKTTPTGRKYKELEAIFIKEARKLGKPPAQLDREIWNSHSRSADLSRDAVTDSVGSILLTH